MVDYDDKLPFDILELFIECQFKLHALRRIKLQRNVLRNKQADHVFLYQFFDYLDVGYAACIFIVAHVQLSGRSSTLPTAKVQIVLLKLQTIPGLKLCTAFFGCQLVISDVERPIKEI